MSDPSRIVVSTRAEARDAAFARAIRASGWRYRSLPASRIRRRPNAVRRLRAVLRHGPPFDWIAVTSGTAAAVVGRALAGITKAEGPSRARIAAIGPASRAAIRREGLRVSIVPAISTGAALAEALLNSGRRTARVLWPRGARSQPDLSAVLRAHGVTVIDPVVYEVTTSSAMTMARLSRAVVHGRVASVCFFAPSAVAHVTAALGAAARRRLSAACIASIGPTTSAALRRAGLAPSVEASRASAGVLAREVLRALRGKARPS